MEYTKAELSLIRRIRSNWRAKVRIRWTRLLFAVGMWTILGVGSLLVLPAVFADSEARSLLWPVLAPLSMFQFALGFWSVYLAFHEWNGNAAEYMLVRILDDLETKATKLPDERSPKGETAEGQ